MAGTLYIAGPMRGLPEFNFPAFFKAEENLKAVGFHVINPAARDDLEGFPWRGATGHENLTELGLDLRTALAWDLERIAMDCTGVALLWGWEASMGAKAEVALANAIQLPVKNVGTWLLDREDGVA